MIRIIPRVSESFATVNWLLLGLGQQHQPSFIARSNMAFHTAEAGIVQSLKIRADSLDDAYLECIGEDDYKYPDISWW